MAFLGIRAFAFERRENSALIQKSRRIFKFHPQKKPWFSLLVSEHFLLFGFTIVFAKKILRISFLSSCFDFEKRFSPSKVTPKNLVCFCCCSKIPHGSGWFGVLTRLTVHGDEQPVPRKPFSSLYCFCFLISFMKTFLISLLYNICSSLFQVSFFHSRKLFVSKEMFLILKSLSICGFFLSFLFFFVLCFLILGEDRVKTRFQPLF